MRVRQACGDGWAKLCPGVCVCEGEGGRGERPRAARCAGVKRRGAGVKALGGGAGGGHGYRRCCWRCSGKCSWRCSCRGDPPGRAEVRCVKLWAVGVSTGGRRLRMS